MNPRGIRPAQAELQEPVVAPVLPLPAPQVVLMRPWPLAQLFADSFGQPPAFRLLRQELQPPAYGRWLMRVSSYQLGEVTLSWHLACLDLQLLPLAAAKCLAAGGNLGGVMARWGFRRQGLQVSFCRAASSLPGPLAPLAAEGFPGPFWLRSFRVVGEQGLGVVWEALPAGGNDGQCAKR